jgi:hypothetical protein
MRTADDEIRSQGLRLHILDRRIQRVELRTELKVEFVSLGSHRSITVTHASAPIAMRGAGAAERLGWADDDLPEALCESLRPGVRAVAGS